MPITDEKKWYANYVEYHEKDAWVKRILNRLNLNSVGFFKVVNDDDKILDTGCGNGNTLEFIHENGKKILFGLDIEPYENPNDDIKLNVGSMLNMPYENNSFDVVYIHNAMHHLFNFEEYDLYVKEVRRVLKPKGYFFIIEPANNLFRKLLNIFVNLPLIKNIRMFKIYRESYEEERVEVELFYSLNLSSLLEKHDFKIEVNKYFIKTINIRSRKI